jgi:hypothetical protein
MQIKLIPPQPHPTILFNLSFPQTSLPHPLPLPQSYQSLLHILNTSSPPLDPPHSIHALDKGTYLVEVVREVEFDMGGGVRIVWVDGGVEEWVLGEGGEGMEKEGCMRMLESVLRDVDMSEEEGEREQWREEWALHQAEAAAAQAQAQANAQAQARAQAQLQAATKTNTKHKKHRSLLMSLVA